MTKTRYLRALEQHMVIKREEKGIFLVTSATQPNTDYIINLQDVNNMACSCMDHKLRNVRCKHIYKVLYNVFGLREDAYIMGAPLLGKQTIEVTDFENCPICFDEIFDKYYKCCCCRKGFHTNCITSWFKSSSETSCPMCRSCVGYEKRS